MVVLWFFIMENTACSKEQNEDCPDVNASQSTHDTEVMPVAMNFQSLRVKEVNKGHNVRDGPVHFVPDVCIRPPEGNTTFFDRSSSPLPPPRRDQGVSVTTESLCSLSPTSLCTLKPPETTDVSSGLLVKDHNDQEHDARNGHNDINRSLSYGMSISEESTSSDFETSTETSAVPVSPPAARNSLSVSQQTLPLGPSRLCRIRQNHLASKKKEQMKSRGTKLPELAENSELDTLALLSVKESKNGPLALAVENTAKVMPLISVTEDAKVLVTASEGPVTPSMPESFLKKLGLAVHNSSTDDASVDQLSEKEIESKFVSLSLAFKTDKLTLDQRVSVQERSRDLAEKNVDTELQGLREAIETLSELLTDAQVRSLLQKIKQHINVLEQSVARVSSRAEVFGAVQQERRMCKAMEVMILYPENLRRIREKEESELQEARKLLSERCGNGFSTDSESGPSRRSMSVCGFNAVGRPMRRRSEVALPRVLGGGGSPSMSPTSNLDHVLPRKRSYISPVTQDAEEGEDPKSRFQSAVASTSIQQLVTSTMRKQSSEKQQTISMSSVPSMPLPVTSTSSLLQRTTSSTLTVNMEIVTDNVSGAQGEKLEAGTTVSQEEDAFRKGFREGLKAKLSQELNELRDQQSSISQILEHVMEKVDKTQMEDEEYLSRPSWYEVTLALASKLWDQILQYDWRSNKTVIRNITGVIFLLLAIIIVLLCPPITSIELGHFAKPSQ